ncbi:unnamed protein product [Cunninghamella echinulata]
MYEGIIGPSPKIFPPMHLIQVISKDGVNLSEEEIEAINEEGPIRIMYKTIEEFEKLEGDRPFEIEEKYHSILAQKV